MTTKAVACIHVANILFCLLAPWAALSEDAAAKHDITTQPAEIVYTDTKSMGGIEEKSKYGSSMPVAVYAKVAYSFLLSEPHVTKGLVVIVVGSGPGPGQVFIDTNEVPPFIRGMSIS